jgi:outer membrane protein
MKTEKRLWVPLVLLAVAFMGLASRAPDATTIATVNVPEVLEQTPGFVEARDRFQSEMDQRQKEMQQLQEQMQSKIRDFENSQQQMNPGARQARIEEIRSMQQNLQDRAQRLDQDARDREQELLGPFQDRVQYAVEQVRAERNLAVVLDVTMDGSPVVAADPDLDITYAVTQRVRSSGR